MKTILYIFSGLAAAGLALSLASHLAALFGKEGPLGAATMSLHVGIFVVWIPAIFAAQRLAKNAPRRDYWRVVLHACPAWMKYTVYVCFAYGILNFVRFLSIDVHESQVGTPPEVVRGFSGHWMAFYSAAMATLYSAAEMWGTNTEQHCPNGHAVPPPAKFCGQCGMPVSAAISPKSL